VPITLSLTDGNYTSWRELMLVALGRYGLTTHVIGEGTPSDTSPTSAWGRDDYTVLSWIYGSIDTDLLGIVMRPGSTARAIWDAIENLFRDNKKHRAIQLEADFYNMPQGDLSISNYCAKLKNLADSLIDVGQPIGDETLVLTLLRGLNDTYAHLRLFLPFQEPFPLFVQMRSTLILEETQRRTDAHNVASTALWAMVQSILPNNGGTRAPLLAIAHRLLPSGAIAPAAAAPTTSPTPSAVEAMVVAAAEDVGAVATTPGSSTLGRGPPLALSSSRPHGSHLHRYCGSLAHRQHGRCCHPASSARAPA
jgi:hypothetical protein